MLVWVACGFQESVCTRVRSRGRRNVFETGGDFERKLIAGRDRYLCSQPQKCGARLHCDRPGVGGSGGALPYLSLGPGYLLRVTPCFGWCCGAPALSDGFLDIAVNVRTRLPPPFVSVSGPGWVPRLHLPCGLVSTGPPVNEARRAPLSPPWCRWCRRLYPLIGNVANNQEVAVPECRKRVQPKEKGRTRMECICCVYHGGQLVGRL